MYRYIHVNDTCVPGGLETNVLGPVCSLLYAAQLSTEGLLTIEGHVRSTVPTAQYAVCNTS